MTIRTAGNPIVVKKDVLIPKNRFALSVKNDCEFQVHTFNEEYNGIIGNNILIPNDGEINYKNKTLKLNDEIIPLFFSENEEKEYEKTINYFNEIKPVDSILNNEVKKDLRTDHLNKEEKQILYKLIKECDGAFYKKGDDLTFTNHVKHNIPTEDNSPIYTRIYRYPEIHKKEVDRQIKEMLESKIIQHSTSPYNAPIWVVPKKEDHAGNKEWRIVIDYRKLNNVTKEDKYPIPNMDSILDKLGQAIYFTTLDLTKGFYQIEVEAKDREKTAFSTLTGHYEFARMPFGLKNAPATFQRLMNEVLKDYIGKICYVYLDDIIIFSSSLQEHMDSLHKILLTLKNANLKVSLNKSEFLRKETEFLGHVVTPNGVKPNPKKIETIKNFPIPKTVREIQSFLGLTGYYRKFIDDYAKIIKPLTLCLKKNSKININDHDYKESFHKLKTLMTNDLINRHPDFSKEFTLTTDASNFAIGAVLSQTHGPLSFASRTLNKHECNYSTIEKELLAIVWATKQFRHYLYGRQFIIKTDHRPLVWLHNLKEPNTRLQRWKIKLEEYDFKIEYIQGKENKVADALSRIKIEDNKVILHNQDELATQHSAESDSSHLIPISEKPVNLFNRQIILEINENDHQEILYPHVGKRRITFSRKEYKEEDFINIIKEVDTTILNCIYVKDDEIFKKFQDIWKKENKLSNKILQRSMIILKDIKELEAREIILRNHKNHNHAGIEKIFLEIKREYYMPNLKNLINKIINNCSTCMAKAERNPIKLPYEKTETPKSPNEHYHIDIWFVNKKEKYISCIDKFSKFAAIEPIKTKTYVDVINALTRIFSYMKKPNKITLDNENAFVSETFKNFLENNNIIIHYCTANRHTGNSDVERLHSSLNEHMRILQQLQLSNEEDIPIKHATKALESYNNVIHLTTKEKPIDVHFNKIDNEIIYKRIEENKIKILNKLNINRKDVSIDENYAKVTEQEKIKNKIVPKHKKVKVINKTDKKYTLQEGNRFKKIPNRILHKDQFRKKKKYQQIKSSSFRSNKDIASNVATHGDNAENNYNNDDYDNPQPSTSRIGSH